MKFKICLLILILINAVLLFYLIDEKRKANNTKVSLQENFASSYYDTVQELRNLVEVIDVINEEPIPQTSRDNIIRSVALTRSIGKQLDQLVNNDESDKIHLMLKVIKDLDYSLKNNEFSNVCYLSEDETVENLEGYLYLLDNVENLNGTGSELYKKFLGNWNHSSDDLEKKCSFKYGF